MNFEGKKILITGAGGSVGSALLRAILPSRPAVIRLFDIDETRLFEIEQEFGDSQLRYLLGDVRSKSRLVRAFEDIDIVFHTAALKHVKSGEYNPMEPVQTNVIGTQNVIDAAIETGVECVINASSDKAANPSNVMGTTKLLAERLITAANYARGSGRTRFWSVRFGNILGSRGSVLPLFARQIRSGGPVTITHEDMTRYIITEQGAVDLLISSTSQARPGDVIIAKMPVMRVVDLAQVMIEELAPAYGLDPKEIEMRYIGLKPGEKLYEELMTAEEGGRAHDAGALYVIPPSMKELLNTADSDLPRVSGAIDSAAAVALTPGEIREILLKNDLLRGFTP